MAGGRSIEPVKPISKPGTRPCGPRPAGWLVTARCASWLRVNWCWTGRRSRFPDG